MLIIMLNWYMTMIQAVFRQASYKHKVTLQTIPHTESTQHLE